MSTKKIEDVLPLAPLQSGLLFHALLDQAGPDVYVSQLVLDIAGDLDVERLRAAADAVVARHTALRTGFRTRRTGEHVQVVLARASAPFTLVDDGAQWDEVVATDAATRFDLAAPPLVRFTVARTGPERHRLLMSNHHLVLDGWSGPLVAADLLAAYAGETLPPVRPFRDHLAWVAAQDHDAGLAAWRSALAGITEPTRIVPAAQGRPPVRSAEVPVEVPAGLDALARAHGVTLNTVVQTLWGLLLARLTGRDDVVFGATVSGRPPELEGVGSMVGLFINTLPVRVRPEPSATLGGLLRTVQDEQSRLLGHQFLPLSQVQGLAGVGELFDTLTVFESYPVDVDALDDLQARAGLRVTSVPAGDATHYPLSLVAVDEGGLRLTLQYRPDVVPVEGAAEIAGRFTTLAQALVADPGARVASVDVLTDAERATLVHRTPTAIPPATYPELFAARVRDTPDAPATPGMTYAQLDAAANRLAHHLVTLGIGVEQRVGLLLPRSPELLVAILGVLTAGAGFVPLDPDNPAERIAYMLDDAEVALVIGGPVQDPAEDPVSHSRLDPADPVLASYPSTPPDVVLRPDHAAYVIYTSGSTGRPKGVHVAHAALTHYLRWAVDTYPGLSGPALLHSPVSFDLTLTPLLGTLLAGGFVDPVPGLDGDEDWAAGGPDFLKVTPSHLALLAHSGYPGSRTLIVGGEELRGDMLTELGAAALAGMQVVNEYGPTETTVGCILWEVTPGHPDGPLSIGTPGDGTDVLILDAGLGLVPPGVVGELYLGGSQLARGYLRRPRLTAARFVAHPLVAGARMYRTGDLARLEADGTISYLGRSDDQVKIRGYRIELGEVEAVLAEQPGVARAAARAEGNRLLGYVVPDPGVDVAGLPERVRAAMTQSLPEHLVPEVVVVLDALPLTTNGKLDRSALPAPTVERAPVRKAATPAEEIVCGLFAQVLDLDEVGPEESFFDLGGHSLSATRLISRIRSALGADLPVRAVFDARTPAALAALAADGHGPSHPTPAAGPRPAELPLSFAQQRLWFLHRLEGPSADHNVPLLVHLDGSLDVDALAAAVTDVVGRHEAVRTVIAETDGVARQVVLSDPAAWPALRLSEEDLDDLAAHPFDLAAEPPLRATLVHTGPSSAVLALVFHHIAADEWSGEPLLRDLETAYRARLDGVAPAWAPLPLQYADYALWQRDLLADVEPAQAAFWTSALAGLPAELTLPVDGPRPAVATYAGATVQASVAADVAGRLRTLAREAGVSPSMVERAAVAVLLHRLGAGEDIPLGSPVAGRTDGALDDLVGCFVNTLVLRVDLAGAPTFRQLLDRVRAADLAAFENQDLPFERLVELLDPERSLARHPLFQVMVTHTAGDPAPLRLPGLTATVLSADPGTARFDLTVDVTEARDGSLTCALEYSSALFSADGAALLARRLALVVQRLVDAPDRPVGDVDVLLPDEPSRLLAGAAAAAEGPLTVPDALALPPADAPALTDGTTTLTFGELRARVNRLARHLATHGAEPERTVGLVLPRSADLVVAILAVQAAGAAPVVVDPNAPAPRQEQLLAAADLVVTEVGWPADLDGYDDAPLDVALHPDQLAYVIHTSGSTGVPKGVAVTHRGLTNLLAAHRADVMVLAVERAGRERLRVAHAAELTFDASWDPLVWMLAGHELVLVDSATMRDPEALLDLVSDREIDFLELTPAYLDRIVELGYWDAATRRPVLLGVGGDAVTPRLRARFADQDETAVVDLYGPTEATVDAYRWRLDRPGTEGPVAGVRSIVLDDELRPAPTGVVGELYLAGPGVARGYHGDPAATAARFVADPYGPPGSRLYRTGDLARRTPAGGLTLHGRSDDQLKIRGYRIEPGEVEAALLAEPGVTGAVVRGDGTRLLAWVTGATTVDLREELSHRLPAHLVPAAVTAVDAFPLTPHGKVDHRALPTPTVVIEQASAATPEEATLGALVAELLGLPAVGPADDFFRIGGDSIVSLQLVARARAAGFAITPRDVFERRTVAGLVAAAAGRAAVETVTDDGTGRVPLTPLARDLLAHGPVPRGFAQGVALVSPPATTAEIEAALQAVLDRHDVLRATLVNDDDGWALHVPAPGSVRAGDLVRHGDLDPEAGRMLRVEHEDRGAEPGRVRIVAHHLVVDGVSWRIVLPDLAEALAAVQAGRAPALAPVGTSMRRWATELEADEAERPYWRSVLDTDEPLLGTRRVDPARDRAAGLAEITTTLPADVTAALLGPAPAAFRAGVDDLLYAALTVARGGGPLLVERERHGRGLDAGLDRTVGWFTDVHPVRLDATGLVDPLDVLKRVKEQLRAAPRDGVGFGPLRLDGNRPQVRLNYLGRFDAASDPAVWAAAPEGVDLPVDPGLPVTVALDVNAVAAPGPDGLSLTTTWTFPADVLDRAAVEAIAATWTSALTDLVRAAAAPGAGGLTPSDAAPAVVSQPRIDELERRYGRLDDILPLTPLQHGLYFHAALDATDVYTAQTVLDLDGPLDVDRLHRAADALVARHPVLRTAFVEGDDGEPLQVVLASAKPQWSDSDAGDRFDLADAPLIRFTLTQLGPDRHRLLVTNHHIVLDGWSSPIVYGDLLQLYAADGDARSLPAAPPYRDHLRRLATLDRAAAREAWRAELAGVDEPALLVPDARGLAPVYPHRTQIALPAGLGERAAALVRDTGVTMNSLVTALWGTLLGRLVGTSDVVFGTTVSGRPPELPGVESMVGLFINTVPVRVRPAAATTPRQLLRAVADARTRLLDHEHVALADTGAADLFDTLMVFESYPVDVAALGKAESAAGLTVRDAGSTDASHYPVALIATDHQGLAFTLHHRPDLVDDERAATIGARLVALLEHLVDHPDAPLATAGALLPGELEQLLSQAGAPTDRTLAAEPGDLPFPGLPGTLHERFAAQAARTPSAIALTSGDTQLTYAELADRVRGLAARLQEAGAGPEDRVAVLLPRSADLVVALLAVHAAGAAYVPIDPGYPAERIAFVLDDARPAVVITDGAAPADLPVVRPDERSAAPLRDAAGPDNTAYLIYTSGSTGTPKGVAVAHRAVTALFDVTRGRVGFDETDVWTLFHSAAFDFSVWEIWGPLLHGGRLVVVPFDVSRAPDRFRDLLVREGVTVLSQTPSAFDQLAAETGDAELAVRTVVFGGEALDPADLAGWAAHRDTALVNMYGITETTVHVTHLRLDPDALTGHASVVGTGLPGLSTHLLDDALRPVPEDVPGELYVGGAQLARGYWQRAGLTASRFVADPWGAPGARLYRSGDRARWTRLPDGTPTLEYLGRADDQVKIRGFRIELGEITAALAEHPDVARAATIARSSADGGTQLVGYVVPGVRDGATVPAGDAVGSHAVLDPAEVRRFVADRLPSHMVPVAVVVLAALPLTANGKLDRRALPEPDLGGEAGRSPSTPEEEAVCAAFAAVLGLAAVGPDQDFFDLGGDSLLATRLTSRLRADLDVDWPVRAVFDDRTPAALARRLPVVPSRARLGRVERPDIVPLSPAQQRLWFLHRMDGPSAVYDIAFPARLRGPLDVDALRAALGAVVERHETLRTVFPDVRGVPHQQVLPAFVPSFEVEDVAVDAVDAIVAEAAGYRFAIDTEAPLHVRLLRTGPDEHVLVLVVHHIAADEWSAGVLFGDLAAAYAGRALAPLPVQYADFTLWQAARPADVEHWRTTLAGLPDEVALPADRERPAVPSYRGGKVSFSLDEGTTAALRALAAAEGATEFMVLQTAVAVLLSRMGAGTDVPLGTPVAGRSDAALDELVGLFVNTLVLRNDLTGDPSLRVAVGRTRDVALDAFAHADVPFERLVEVIDPERSPSRHPLFQTMVVHSRPQPAPALGGLTLEPLSVGEPAAKFDLTVEFADVDTGIEGSILFAHDRFDRTTAEGLRDRLLQVLDVLATAPDTALHDVDVLVGDERATILGPWARGLGAAEAAAVEPGAADVRPARAEAAPAAGRLLSERFAAQVVAHPDRVALTCGDEQLTYASLDARAAALAGRIAARGIGTEDVVALALPRSVDMVVAVLAAIRTGAAYLPLDPAYPAERLAFTVADASPKLLVTVGDTTIGDVPVLHLDRPSDEAGAAVPVRPLRPDAPAYVIYTSGSTGVPKGVAVPHSAVTALFDATGELFTHDETDVWTLFHSYAFDFSVWELWGPLLHGGRLVVVPIEVTRSPGEMLDLVAAQGVTVLSQTPSAFHPLAAADALRDDDPCATLRTVVFGGEALDPTKLAAWFARHPVGPDMVNMYGITETTVHVTHRLLTAHDALTRHSPVGVGLPGLRVHVLDDGLAPVPPGVAGEVYVGGPQLARGYLGRAGLSAGRFVADPFGPPGARLYRSGDVARWTRDGELDFVGRSDSQVTIRGFRIELGEIEAALLADPAVSQAAVMARTDRGEPQLVGYVVGGLDPAELRESLSRTLPAHMVPAAVVVLDALPLTVNGKLDVRALPAPDFAGLTGDRTPATEVEARLCRAFAEVLGLPTVGPDDSFFALGGDSIMSIQLVSTAREDGIAITPRAVFERRTPAGLAAVATLTGAAAVRHDDGVGEVPATPILAEMLERGGDHRRFSQSTVLTLPASVTGAALRHAVATVVDHHGALRARLAGDHLVVPAPGSLPVERVLRREALPEGATWADSWVVDTWNAAADRLDVEDGVPIQVVWLDGGDRGSRLFVLVHHAVVDGVSWRILGPDLAAAYRGEPLAPVPTSLRTWALGLTALDRSAELPLWREVLADPEPALGTRELDPEVDVVATMREVVVEVPADVTDAVLTTVPEAFHGGVDDVLLSGLALATAKVRGGEHVLVGLEGHGREDDVVDGADLSRTVGWFTSVHPARLDLTGLDVDDAFAGGPAAGTLVKRVKEHLRSLPDRGIGFGLLQNELAGLPRPQIAFNYLGRMGSAPGTSEPWTPAPEFGALGGTSDATAPATWPLEVNAMTDGGLLRATWAHPPGVVDTAVVESLAAHWVEALTALARHVEAGDAGGLTPSDVSLVSVSQEQLDLLGSKWGF
ncbi:non-ribosomal peptide synthetase [Pseudonocardia sp. N23]|uniref:non-ribosomal peptide synthetase n=1 Tax=Pseudonocardia sp. N23 TaxID=1987376 RepID=UPI0015591B84|nr:non-ribosomal peptide synthetase [Pseudonocardia sp. N23]